MFGIFSFWAVIISTLVVFGLGILWYSKYLFGKVWIRNINISPEKMSKMMPFSMIFGIASNLVMVLVYSYIFFSSLIGPYTLALAVWAGFNLTAQLSNVLWEGKSFKVFLIDVSYSLVSFILVAFIFSLFIG